MLGWEEVATDDLNSSNTNITRKVAVKLCKGPYRINHCFTASRLSHAFPSQKSFAVSTCLRPNAPPAQNANRHAHPLSHAPSVCQSAPLTAQVIPASAVIVEVAGDCQGTLPMGIPIALSRIVVSDVYSESLSGSPRQLWSTAEMRAQMKTIGGLGSTARDCVRFKTQERISCAKHGAAEEAAHDSPTDAAATQISSNLFALAMSGQHEFTWCERRKTHTQDSLLCR